MRQPAIPQPPDPLPHLDAIALGRAHFGRVPTPVPPNVKGFREFVFIAAGGLGQVWRAIRDTDGLEVALKAPLSFDPEFTERLMLEAETLQALKHPNIVTLIDLVFDEQQNPILVMELVEGEPLSVRLPQDGFSLSETLDIFLPILEAIEHAHDHGVVHRDLKPANILFTVQGVPKICDLGLAASLQSRRVAFALTRSGAVAGTVEYLAPECYEPEAELSCAADIYALGIMLYELLTGRPPRGSWTPLSQARLLDVRLDDLVVDAIHPDPFRRLPSAAIFKKRLEAIRDSPPRYAGTPLMTRPVQALDVAWTLLGLYFLAAGYCSQQSLNNTNVPALFDLTFGHTQYLAGFWAVWIITCGLGLMGVWQLWRLWHFRHVPMREALPSPFGLKLGFSRGAAWLVAASQTICFLGPAFYAFLIAQQTWHWLTPTTPLWEHALAVTRWGSNTPVSPWSWDPSALFRADRYWVREVVQSGEGGYYSLDRQSFFIFLQPLLMTLGLAAYTLALGTTVLGIAGARGLSRSAQLALAALSLGGVGWWGWKSWAGAEVKQSKFPDHAQVWLDALAADLFQVQETAPSLRMQHAIDGWVQHYALGSIPKFDLLRWVDTTYSHSARRAQHIEAFTPLHWQRSPTNSNWFNRSYAYEVYSTTPDGIATGAYELLLWGIEIAGFGPACRLREWRVESQPLYSVIPRELSVEDQAAWLHAWFEHLAMPECPDLESQLAPVVMRLDPAFTGPEACETPAARSVLASALRVERSRWQSLKFSFSTPQGAPLLLPGARYRIVVVVRSEGVLSTGRAVTYPNRRWSFELIPVETGWQALRVQW